MDAWRRILDRYTDRPYAWPVAYCGAMLDDLLCAELGQAPGYATVAARAATEADMLGYGIKRHGTVGAAHDAFLTAVRGVFRVMVREGEGVPAYARLAWVDGGRVRAFEPEASPRGAMSEELSDRRGAMLMRGPVTMVDEGLPRPWFMWTQPGLAETVVAGARIARAWGW